MSPIHSGLNPLPTPLAFVIVGRISGPEHELTASLRTADRLSSLHENWLNSGGMLVAGIDHYRENDDSHDWPDALNVHMTTLSIDEWKAAMIDAGFIDVEMHQVAASESFLGTLVMCGKKN